MLKIITAMNNQEINGKLKKEKDIEVLAQDICYGEGIIEIIEKYKKIDFLLMNKKIYTNIKIEELIKEIKERNKKIKIILFIERNDEIISHKNIYKIIDEKINIEDLLKIIRNNYNKEIEKSTRVITILGTNGIGKTLFSLILAKTIAKNEKILIINAKEKNFLKDEKINKNIHIKTKIINLDNNYKYIIIEPETITKFIIENTDLFIFLLGGNLIEIQKAKEMLKEYSKKINHIKIIINKYTEESLDMEILKNIFNNYEIIGKIKFNKNYDLIVNKKIKNISKDIKKDYSIIIKKMKGDKIWGTRWS